MYSGISRRAFLSVFPLGLAAQVKQLPKKGKPLPVVGEFVRIVDPVTENVVIRLDFSEFRQRVALRPEPVHFSA